MLHFFAPVPSQEFLTSVCLISFSLVGFFMLLEYIVACLSLYPCILMFLGQLFPALCYEDFLVVHWRPMGGLGLTCSSQWSYFLFDINTIPILVMFVLVWCLLFVSSIHWANDIFYCRLGTNVYRPLKFHHNFFPHYKFC